MNLAIPPLINLLPALHAEILAGVAKVDITDRARGRPVDRQPGRRSHFQL
jgi:hypothetical protein